MPGGGCFVCACRWGVVRCAPTTATDRTVNNEYRFEHARIPGKLVCLCVFIQVHTI